VTHDLSAPHDAPPAHLADSLVVSAPFRGLCMRRPADGAGAACFAVVATEPACEHFLPVTLGAFALIAAIASGPHQPVLVLCRQRVHEPFESAGLFSVEDAQQISASLSG
jgi:hypothetical protein